MLEKSVPVIIAIHKSGVIQSLSPQPPRDVERARIAYLARRLRIAPQLAAVVAPIAFGEARQ